MTKKILFVSSTNLTTNPRILKEIKLAVSSSYSVEFLGFWMDNWSAEIEKKHIEELQGKVQLHYINAGRKPFLPWLYSSVLEHGLRNTYSIWPKTSKIDAYASNKRSILLAQWLRKNKPKADLIIAHTLGTLFPVFQYATDEGKPFAFDVEDYHPGEVITNNEQDEKNRRINLLKKILPSAEYVSCASPLIEQKIRNSILDGTADANVFTVNNCFSGLEFASPKEGKKDDKLKLVWFSQNISAGRGLELVLPLLSRFSEQVSLTLIGNSDPDFYDAVVSKYVSFVRVLPPLPQADLHQKLSEFDVGLAIEDVNADENRNICLTNKIWSYFQAGLFILATDTSGQKKFILDNPEFGAIFSFEQQDFVEKLGFLLENKGEILAGREARFLKTEKASWEHESEKLNVVWDKILNHIS